MASDPVWAFPKCRLHTFYASLGVCHSAETTVRYEEKYAARHR